MTTPHVQEAIDRELALLTPEVRRDPVQIDALLDPAFREIGVSGRLWSRESMIAALAAEQPAEHPAEHPADQPADPPEIAVGDTPKILAEDLDGTEIAPGLVLLTYVSVNDGRRARRSSLWRANGDSWQIVFHQGTASEL